MSSPLAGHARRTRGWNALYLENHDQPRSVSRFGDPSQQYWYESATALATAYFLQRYPLHLSGPEIGMLGGDFGPQISRSESNRVVHETPRG